MRDKTTRMARIFRMTRMRDKGGKGKPRSAFATYGASGWWRISANKGKNDQDGQNYQDDQDEG